MTSSEESGGRLVAMKSGAGCDRTSGNREACALMEHE